MMPDAPQAFRRERRSFWWWGGVAFTVLVASVVAQRRPIFWDEVPYLGQAAALSNATSFTAWLRNNDAGPCGPVHALLNFAASGGRGILPVPWVRLPNLVLLGLIIGATGGAIGFVHPRRGFLAIAALAVPMTWVICGMAITEPPAMVGAALSLYSALGYANAAAGTRQRIGWGIALAAGLAVATCGRQTYLAIGPALLVLAARKPREVLAVGLILLAGVVPLFALFWVWGGPVPPKLAFVGGGVRPIHALMAVSLTGILALLLAPRFYMAYWRRAVPVGLLAAVVNLVVGAAHFTTLTSVQRMFGNPAWGHLLERSMDGFAVFFGVAFVVALIEAAWRSRSPVTIGAALGVLGLCGICAAIAHQFSSRYPAMALPFLILLLVPWMDTGRWALLRYSGGALIGFAVLRSYYLFAP